MSSLPMYFPSDFDLETAQLCAELTAHAYRMYAQWVEQDKPRKEDRFRWQTPSDTGLRFSSPIWSTIRTLFITNDSEPFGFVASDGAGKGYMVFRGTASVNNWFLDLDSDQEPYDLAPGYGEVHDGFLKLYRSLRDDALKALDHLFKSEIDPARVAAMIIEPVLGEGGFYIAPPEYLRALRKLCDEHGILFIADEIQTGFARTGRLFAIEHAGIEPDMVTMAKSLAGGFPLSAVTGKAKFMDAPNPGGLGGTYAGAPMACAAALAVIEVIEHLDVARLRAFERVLFEQAHPRVALITTPNSEYNARFESLPAGQFRHPDHRFEWTRAEFESWGRGIAERFGYAVRFEGIGEADASLGAPTQMAVFEAR